MKFGTVMHGETDVKLKFYMADCRNSLLSIEKLLKTATVITQLHKYGNTTANINIKTAVYQKRIKHRKSH